MHSDHVTTTASRRWFKGNLHAHSLWSDGDAYPEIVASWYRDHGYHFLSVTEHNVLAVPGQPDLERWVDIETSGTGIQAYERLLSVFPDDVERRTTDDGRTEVRLRTFAEVAGIVDAPGEFLLIQGEEITDLLFRTGKDAGAYREQWLASLRSERLDGPPLTADLFLEGTCFPVHINAHNVGGVILPAGGADVLEIAQRNFDRIAAEATRTGRRMLAHLNHPNFYYAIGADDLARLQGVALFEVYNGHEMTHSDGDTSHPPVERLWDLALTTRLTDLGLPLLYGIGVDDGHDYHGTTRNHGEPGRGWVQVHAESLTVDALFDALEAGRFYASSGVELLDIETACGSLAFHIDAAEGVQYLTEFIGTRGTEVGVVLASTTETDPSYAFVGDELYVRARVTSSLPHASELVSHERQRAWIQPVLGPAHTGTAATSPSETDLPVPA